MKKEMLQDIKFKAKSLDGQWVTGSLVYIQDRAFIVSGNQPPAAGTGVTIMADEVNPETVGRYSGHKDKNGTEIYDGDILRDDFVTGMAMDGDTDEAFTFNGIPVTIMKPEAIANMEVVGSIHEENNPLTKD